jgi:glycosyltransferase involved in cell wall biosynthesis
VVAPPDQGSSARTYNLLLRLSARHDVRQFSQPRRGRLRPGEPRELHVNPRYRELRWTNPLAGAVCEVGERTWVGAPALSGLALDLLRPRALRDLLGWAEVILVEFPWQFGHCARHRGDAPIVYAAHNLEAEKFASYAAAAGVGVEGNRRLRAIEATEARAAREADLVVAVTEADRRGFAERYGIDPAGVVVAPNGADTERYRPADAETRRAARRSLGLPDRPVVMFAGSRIAPNRYGLEWVRQLAARDQRFTFLVVGAVAPRPRVEGNLVLTGFVDDFPRYLSAADFALCPIEYGAGTKIKLLESLAAGLPVLAFAEATSGLGVRDGEHLLVVDKDVEALGRGLDRLAGDAALAERLSAAARAYVCEHHDWDRIAADLDAALERLVAGS